MRNSARAALAVLALALLVPGPGSSYFIQHVNWRLDPAVSPEQYRPAADGTRPDVGNPPVAVEVELLPLGPGAPREMVEAAAAAVARWNGIPGSAMRVRFKPPAAGATDDANWAARYEEVDGKNTIEFITSDWPWFFGPTIIAMTVPKLDPDGRIVEADVFCNAQDFKWGALSDPGTSPGLADRRLVDAEAILTHELGHVLGLGHSQNQMAAMYGDVGLADPRARWLTEDDRAGLRALYPSSPGSAAAPSIIGIHPDDYPAGDCGMGELSISEAASAYLDRAIPLPGPHYLIPDTTAEFAFCLYGSGFSRSRFMDVDLMLSGQRLAAVADPVYVGPNFVKARVMNGSSGFAALAPAGYDVAVVQDPGGAGILAQGLFVNPAGNAMPEAVIEPEAEQAPAGTWIRLDGSGSTDRESATLSYQWSVPVSPDQAPGELSSATDPVTSVYLPAPGYYVVRLVVNDGTVDSVADQVLITAAAAVDDGTGPAPFSCSLAGNDGERVAAARIPYSSALLAGALPVLIAMISGLLARRCARSPWSPGAGKHDPARPR